MAKVLKIIGIIAGVVAFAAGAFTAIAGATAASSTTIAGVSISSIGAIAGLVSTVALFGAYLLTKPPNAKGSVNSLTIGANQPTPCIIGRTYSGGTLVHDTGYGGTVDKVPNPYRFLAVVYSIGLCAALEACTTDFTTQTFSGTSALGYYAGFLYRDYQLGATPESDALQPHWSGATNWGSDYKLSGLAAIGWTLKFDKKGKIFASGVPQLGAIWQGVAVYDPREDSTYPGGSGSQRIDDESTWQYSDNPALHALAYAYGRYQNGKRVFGVDLGDAAISVQDIVGWANVCDANFWTIGGTIFEPGDGGVKWNNLKAICQAGSAEPYFAGGILRFRWDAPRVSTETITLDDLADGDVDYQGITSWKERLNTVIARWRSEEQQWTYVQAPAQSDSIALLADGEEKTREIQLDLVQYPKQAAQLARYIVANSRELGPLALPLKPRLAAYGAGSAIKLGADLAAQIGLPADQMMVVRSRSVDASTGIVTLVLNTENSGKHAFALDATGAVPSALTPIDPQTRDLVFSGIAAVANDGVLTGDEKQRILKPLQAQLESAYAILDARAAGWTGFSSVVSARSAASSARSAWLALLAGLSPAWDDDSLSTVVDRDTYDATLLAYQSALDTLSDALRDAAAKTAQWPNITGTGKPADNADVTAANIAAGIAGQTTWATYPGYTPAQALTPQGNLVYNGGFRLQGNGWTFTGSWGSGNNGPNNQPYIYATTAFAGSSQRFLVTPGASYTLQCQAYTSGLSSGKAIAAINWYDGSLTKIGFSSKVTLDAGAGWTPLAATGLCPAGAVWGEVVIYTANADETSGTPTFSGGAVAWSQVKAEQASQVSIFTDEATYGANYIGGVTIDALKPAEANANVTETRVAAAITGQSSWATYGGLNPVNVAGQVQWLDTGGYLSGIDKVSNRRITLLKRADGATDVTEGAVVTSLGISAGFDGQGTLATKNSADWATDISGTGKPADNADVTAANIAAGIAGQASWATYGGLNPVNVAGQVQWLDTGGYLSGIDKVSNRRITLLKRADGATDVTEGLVVTSLGTAAAITGQGTFATKSSADWLTDISGTGKPSDYATRNDDGANMLEAPTTLATAVLYSGTAIREDTGASGAARDRYRIRLDSDGATYFIQSKPITVNAGEQLWMRAQMYAGAGVAGTSQFGLLCYDSSDVYVANVVGPINSDAAGTGWFQREVPVTIPAGVAQVRPYFQRYGGSGGYFYLAEPLISRGQGGADITLQSQITLDLADIIVNAASDGTVASGQLPRTVTATLLKGSTDIRTASGVSWSVDSISSNLTGQVSVNSSGQVTIGTGITGSGTFRLIAAINSIGYAITVAVTKKLAAASGTSSKSASGDLGSAGASSSSYVTAIQFSGMSVSSGETIRCTANGDYGLYGVSSAGRARMTAKWQYSVAGANSWTDFASAATGSDAYTNSVGDVVSTGTVTCNQNKSGLSAGNYDVRLVIAQTYVSGASGTLTIDSGSCAVAIAP